ncbi:L-seryl-tRNA(Sec) selenium transferase [Geosporobacter ferrireducens]|uniref:L-seryl-tRNA(Sec) selenium transferase n=1 Tax=Geosporobacter ferrireducens TaxID=1424294 RepID=A0A1D8GR09_9FIRM|nr:L-seryl-tRNA(Sec) selenium transferase [Geosporobacter ferrireducens]AOT73318.1 L-seryl-tRNA(Sec) selenium transferase [Geosporobacter ferrireducens]MTI55201.1 L-seryl-tRNA(Sec) selenium transferase [Geosporobacter ferrireducens]
MHKKDLFCLIPKVDELLNEGRIHLLFERFPRTIIVDTVRACIEEIRQEIIGLNNEEIDCYCLDEDRLIQRIAHQVESAYSMNLKRVINATGVVIHTNLGRSLLSDEIRDEVWNTAVNYSTLEFNVETGSRGSRYTHVEGILSKLCGSEAAMVVNNNAAAVLLVLGAIAKNKEVIVSRGQLVEIGGSFRIPEVMEQSGARLKEVGTTNKTHLLDYERAIHEETAALLKVHTSNYKILGFTQEVLLSDMVALGEKYNIPVVEDIGSGTLIDFSKYGLAKEPTVQESIAEGADIVTFSGDKLLGGPQAGIIVGKKKYIDIMKKNPLTRALRVDKLTLAALEATLRLYLDEKSAIRKIPTLHMLTMPFQEIEEKAKLFLHSIKQLDLKHDVRIERGVSQVGGGAMPLEELPTLLIALKPLDKSVNQIENELRNRSIPIIARISDDHLLFDCRTIKREEFDIVLEAFADILRT